MMQIEITENFKSDREKCLNLALLECSAVLLLRNQLPYPLVNPSKPHAV